MMPPDIILAHKQSSHHRWTVLNSFLCGCFYCLQVFDPNMIKEWIDEVDGVGQTALCPYCGIDSVIGSRSGYPVEEGFLRKLKEYWFDMEAF